jgi:GDPmannose 4,6-dehydratase
LTSIYRQSYGLHASSGFLFNHTSPRRGKNFVCRKITVWFAKYLESIIKNKPITPIILGNIDSFRDFGHSKDYVEAQWLMLQQDKPDDYVISSGETHSIRELLQLCFGFINKKIEWDNRKGKENEIGTCDGNIVVKISSKYIRPLEVDYLLGDSTKARKILGWTPTYTFSSLFREMVIEDTKTNGLSEIDLKKSVQFS